MPKKSKTKSKRKKSPKRVSTASGYSHFFGGNRRYTTSNLTGPSLSGHRQVSSFYNKVPGYVTKTMEKVGNIVWAWHGTSEESISRISESGLLPNKRRYWGTSGLFGRGIYTAPSSGKAFAHALKHYNPSKLVFILKCRVALGRPHHPSSNGDMRHLMEDRYDSVHAMRGNLPGAWGNSLANDEYVVYNPEQVTVDQVFIYKRMEKSENPRDLGGRLAQWGRNRFLRKVPAGLDLHPCKRNGVICANAHTTLKGVLRKMACILPSSTQNLRMGQPLYCRHFQKSLALPRK